MKRPEPVNKNVKLEIKMNGVTLVTTLVSGQWSATTLKSRSILFSYAGSIRQFDPFNPEPLYEL